MKSILVFALVAFVSLTGCKTQQPVGKFDDRCFEMRTYYAAPGRLDDLQARFRQHTCKLFKKHRIDNIGYWVPLENPDNKLIYLLAYPNRNERDISWKLFASDPTWQEVAKASEAKGKLVTKVESVFLAATDFSPELKPQKNLEPRVFELRTYTASPGKLPNLLARFRDHTCNLFEQHGMSNVGYWVPTDANHGANNTLVYILAHKSKEAADGSFSAFRADPKWVAAKAASEKKAGGPLTVTNGVVSLFMKPTDFSPIQ